MGAVSASFQAEVERIAAEVDAMTPGQVLAARARRIACARAQRTGVPHAVAVLRPEYRLTSITRDATPPFVVGPSHHEHRELLSAVMERALPSATLVRHLIPHPEETP